MGLESKGYLPSHPHIQAYSRRLLGYYGETILPNLDLSPLQLFFRSYAQVGSGHLPPQLAPCQISTLLAMLEEGCLPETPSPKQPQPSATDVPAVIFSYMLLGTIFSYFYKFFYQTHHPLQKQKKILLPNPSLR